MTGPQAYEALKAGKRVSRFADEIILSPDGGMIFEGTGYSISTDKFFFSDSFDLIEEEKTPEEEIARVMHSNWEDFPWDDTPLRFRDDYINCAKKIISKIKDMGGIV